jgi:PKD domain-containing protein
MTRTTIAGLASLVTAAALTAGCSDAVGPDRGGLGTPLFAVAQVDAALDQQGGSLNERGPQLRKGFDAANPRLGSAIVATFFWYGSGTITSVSDNLSNGTPVGNTYQLVDVVRAGAISMATYVALDAQNFPPLYHDVDCSDGGCFDSILVVRATFSDSVAGGIQISSFMGVDAVGTARSASGSGSTAPTLASVGGIPVTAGALVYGVTMADAVVDPVRPAGYGMINTMTESEAPMWTDAEYAVQASSGTADPQWQWAFSRPSTWLVTALALNQVNRPPSVNAGADEKAVSGLFYTLNATFGDPDNNGPWSYRIDWGDGSTTTGTAASRGSISASHNYVSPLPSSYTIGVTVTDSRGASGSDTKIFTVGL